MAKFETAFKKFMADGDGDSLMKEISGLVDQSDFSDSDLYDLNKLYSYEGQKLSPLSIIIRMAKFIDNPIPLIESMLSAGCRINVDYGYHGDRHPDRASPPLIEAIQLSLVKDEKKQDQDHVVSNFELYTKISQLLLKHGASVNKIGDNISPLLACYNPKVNKIVAEEKEIKGTHEEIEEFTQRKRNSIIFSALLKSNEIDVQEFDIVANVEIDWRKAKDGSKSYGSLGFQLLHLIDTQLKIYPDAIVKKEFFEPLFEKFCQSTDHIIKELDKPLPIYDSQKELDESFESGLLFSAVTRFPDSKIEKIAERIAKNDEVFVDDLVKPVIKDKIKEMQCLAGMYSVPTQYFGSKGKVLMEGLLYHAYHVYPLIHAKTDLYSGPRRGVSHQGRTVSTVAFQDFTYKIRNYSFIEMWGKMLEAEQRRSGKVAEVRPRPQQGRGGGKSGDDKLEEIYENGQRKKKPVKQHYTQIYDHKVQKVVTLNPSDRSPVGIYHNEMLCMVTKPIAILSVYNVDKTLDKEASTKDHDLIVGLHEAFANLRDLQRQRHYFNLTGEYIPIVKASSIDNHPILVETTDLQALSNIFKNKNDVKKLFKYASLFADEKQWGKNILGDIIQFYRNGPESVSDKDTQNLLLLWAISMGFSDSALNLLKQGAKVDPDWVKDLKLLDDVLKKGYLDEAKYLLSLGCVPHDPTLIAKVKTQFGSNSLNDPEKNFYTNPDSGPIHKPHSPAKIA